MLHDRACAVQQVSVQLVPTVGEVAVRLLQAGHFVLSHGVT